jgi:dihydroflavonol-4-reductase
MAGADAVVHNSGWYEFGMTKKAAEKMRAINVEGTRHTLGLAGELGIPRIVYTSSIVAYGPIGDAVADETCERCTPPASVYEETKTEAHRIAVDLQKKGAPVVIVCPAGVIGPGDHSGLGILARMYVRRLLPPVLFGAEGRRAHVHVDDCAEAIALCVDRGRTGESYILSSGIMRHRDLFELWKTTPGGAKATWFWMPEPMAVAFSAAAEPFERLLGLPVLFCREFARAAFEKWAFSAAKAERELGMRFRSVEQAWLYTLEAERAAAMGRNRPAGPAV